MNKSISRKFIAVLLSFVMTTGMAVAASVPVFAEEAVPSVTTTWANEDYPVIQNENGEYIAVNSEGKPVKYNGLQIKTTTTENTDGTRVEETGRYTFKNGKCTQVKESRTTTLEPGQPAAATADPNATPVSTKVTYSNPKYSIQEDGDTVKVISEKGNPVKYNGILIRTMTTTNSDGSQTVTKDRFTFKDGVQVK